MAVAFPSKIKTRAKSWLVYSVEQPAEREESTNRHADPVLVRGVKPRPRIILSLDLLPARTGVSDALGSTLVAGYFDTTQMPSGRTIRNLNWFRAGTAKVVQEAAHESLWLKASFHRFEV